ncbi:MAG: biotin-dependent carboxyltransferase family protein [Firmicutes bacterium]|nr:biotin-dependent carboxyltransferase family protein [Bacillota bacterium]
MGIKIIKGGLMTTVQDAGRRGYQRYGMGVSGAVDVHSYHYANILVGNERNEAVLEATMIGPSIRFQSDSVIAVTGGDLSPSLDGKPCPMYRAVPVPAGSVLSFGMMKSGCRAYIAFAGGLEIYPVMGSRSTYIKAGLGGFDGRKLKDGDEIAFARSGFVPKNLEKRILPEELRFDAITRANRVGATETATAAANMGPREYTVRVLLGPQDDRFTDKGLETFLNSAYKVTDQFDRMGCRLTGPKIEHVTDGNIITDGIAFGAIQVPDSGEPIIMLSDRQTTGGYAKIASIINVDMPMIAQAKTGDTIRFVKTDIDTAQDEFIAQIERYKELQDLFDGTEKEKPTSGSPADKEAPAPKTAGGKYLVRVNGKAFHITLKEIE